MSSDSVLNHFQKDAVVMFVGAHPDDEHTIGPLLARAADVCRKVSVLSLTKGESGWNLHREDLSQTLAQVREKEFVAAMEVLGCEPLMFDYINGMSFAHPEGLAVLEYEAEAVDRWRAAGGRDKSMQDVWERWTQESGDPIQRLLKLFEERKPTVVMAFDPVKGYTNHVEHVVAAQAATEAVKLYNRTAAVKAAVFYAHSPSNEVPGAERINSSMLSELGGKDYRAMADESQKFYESQYGTRGSEHARKYLFAWHDQQLIEKAVL